MFDEGGVKRCDLSSENNDGFPVVTTVSYFNRVQIVSPVIRRMSFLRLWLTHTAVYKTSGHLILNSNENDIRAACFATRPEPPEWRGDGGWTGGRKGRREEARQGRGRNRGSASRNYINTRQSVRLCEGGVNSTTCLRTTIVFKSCLLSHAFIE